MVRIINRKMTVNFSKINKNQSIIEKIYAYSKINKKHIRTYIYYKFIIINYLIQ